MEEFVQIPFSQLRSLHLMSWKRCKFTPLFCLLQSKSLDLGIQERYTSPQGTFINDFIPGFAVRMTGGVNQYMYTS